MILVDRREHDQHPQIARALQKLGLPVEVTELTFGDVAWTGRGVGDVPVFVGVELKRLTTSDAIDSIRSGRLADHQIPGMIGPDGIYEYGFLCIEGQYRVNDHGQLLVLDRDGWRLAPRGMTAAELEKSVFTYELCSGMHVRYTNKEQDTLRLLVNLYRWFTDKPMDAHTSHLAAHQPQGILPLSDFRATLQVRCPGMGRAMSKAAEVKFGGSLRRAAMAPAQDWATVAATDRKGKTKRLGLKRGTEIEQWWRG